MKKLDLSREPDLLEAVRAGEARAFSLVHGAYHRRLIGYAYNMVASLENAEDIVAEAFYQLFVARAGMKNLGHVRRFLFMVTKNKAVDWVRARRVRARMIGSGLVDLSGEAAETDESLVAGPGAMHRIYDAVEGLPRKCREVFKLYFYEEMSTAEIAALLKLNPQTVLNHKSCAVKSLRSRLVLWELISS
jgi:RNA polymerase sigma factor (sigma-70 family)